MIPTGMPIYPFLSSAANLEATLIRKFIEILKVVLATPGPFGGKHVE